MSLLPLGVHQGYNRDEVAGQRSVHDGLSAPADATGRAPVKIDTPAAQAWGASSSIMANGGEPLSADQQADQKIAHMDSVLTDAGRTPNFNVLHFGQSEVDKAKADSARIAGNIEALKGAPQVTGGDSIRATTPQERMANPKMPRAK